METVDTIRKILSRKRMFSFGYLIIAIGLSLLLFIPNKYTGEFVIVPITAKVSPIYRIALFIIICTYLAHFYYGAIHFIRKYKKAMKPEKNLDLDYEEEAGDVDNSIFRGYLIGAISALIISIVLSDHASLWVLFLANITWFALHFFLNKLSKTSNLFELTSINVDKAKLLPWEYQNKKRRYIRLILYLPIIRDKKEFKRYKDWYLQEYAKAKKEEYKL